MKRVNVLILEYRRDLKPINMDKLKTDELNKKPH